MLWDDEHTVTVRLGMLRDAYGRLQAVDEPQDAALMGELDECIDHGEHIARLQRESLVTLHALGHHPLPSPLCPLCLGVADFHG
jgi:hypothetical protein